MPDDPRERAIEAALSAYFGDDRWPGFVVEPDETRERMRAAIDAYERALLIDVPEREPEDAAERALAFLESLADQWAEEIELPELIQAVSQATPLEPRVDALVRQAFIEGAYRGFNAHKELTDRRAAIDAYERETWQSIESAPKDGSAILAYLPGDENAPMGVSIVRYLDYPYTDKHMPGWGCCNGITWTAVDPEQRWRPLPVPPEADESR